MSNPNFRSTAIFLSLIALYLFLQLFRLPLTPILFEGDHSIHLSNAWRMYLGESAFKDFFLVTFPGTELFYLLLFKLFGVQISIINFTLFGLLLALSAIGLFFSRRILTGLAVYLPVPIFIIVGFRTLGTHGSHRYFSVIFVMMAFVVLFSKRTFQRLILAGALCGIASCFTQPRGVVGVAAIVLFLLIEKFFKKQTWTELLKSILCVWIPFALVIAFLSLYFIASAGFDAYYFATFVFPVKHYPADIWNNPQAYFKDVPNFGTIPMSQYLRLAAPSLFFYFLIPFIYLIFFAVFWLKRQTIPRERQLELIFINLAGLMLAIGVFSSPTAGRLYQVSIFGIISLFWIYQQFFNSRITTSLLLIVVSMLGAAYTFQRQTTQAFYLNTPSGVTAVLSPELFSRYEWINDHTEPFDYLYEAADSSLYMIFRLKNPTPLSWIRPSNFTPVEQADAVLKGLESNPPRYIVWNGVWDVSANASNSPDYHLGALVDYLHNNYHRLENLDSFEGVNGAAAYQTEIWERNDQ
jgi:hypothetical protein